MRLAGQQRNLADELTGAVIRQDDVGAADTLGDLQRAFDDDVQPLRRVALVEEHVPRLKMDLFSLGEQRAEFFVAVIGEQRNLS